ncbi:MAG: hypothetical protein RLZZ144_2 [Pseudomonadota bacterium]|jgi:putative heme iron utilization protein
MITDNLKSQQHGRQARQLLRAHRYGALSTLSKKFDGHPFASITPYFTDFDGSLLILISGLAEHTKNIQHDARVSLITHDQHDPQIQTQGRVTVLGNATKVDDRDLTAQRYLRYFPEAARYLDMQDFQFYRIVPQAIRFIGGFGNIHWVKAHDYLLRAYDLMRQEENLLQQSSGFLDEMVHRKNLPAFASGEIQLVGVDADGFDIRQNEQIQRLDFPELVTDIQQILPSYRA